MSPALEIVSSWSEPVPAPPKNVVVLHTRVVTGTGGGPDKTILNSPRFLVGTGYEAHCAYLHPPADPDFEAIRNRAVAADAPLIGIPDRGLTDLSVVRSLLRVCRQLNVGIWHGHDYKTNALGLLLRRFHRMKLVTTVHGWVRHTKRTPLYYWIDRQSLRFYDRVIAVSPDLYDIGLQCGVRPDRCILIENAIDTEEFRRSRDRNSAKRELGFDPTRPLIGAVGRLSEEKGFDHLIRAVDQLHRQGRDVQLAIAGEGDQLQNLQSLIAQQSRPEYFRLLGFVADTKSFYQALDVFALSSLREGLPNVLLEAMAFEVPVVATAIAGIPRLIAHEQNGLLVPPADESTLGAALAALLSSTDVPIRLGGNARKTILERYDFRVRMEKIRRVYDGVFEAKTTGLAPDNGNAHG